MAELTGLSVEQLARFGRQINYPRLQQSGQKRLIDASVVVVGVGALGTMISERLVRAGVGRLRLIDRDWVEIDNLPRQTLFTQADAQERRPKSITAKEHLEKIDSNVFIEATVGEYDPSNAVELVQGSDLILDGSDNFETRYLINDVALELGIPWVHGGVIGGSGQVMTIVPGQTCCLRCIFPDLPNPEELETCNSAGVLGPAVAIVASWQAMEAIKLLTGHREETRSEWISIEVWDAAVRRFTANAAQLQPHCPACGQGQRDFLNGNYIRSTTVLCGRNAVQISSPTGGRRNLEAIADKFNASQVQLLPFLLRIQLPPYELTVFGDGRTIVAGTEDATLARKLIDQWIGG